MQRPAFQQHVPLLFRLRPFLERPFTTTRQMCTLLALRSTSFQRRAICSPGPQAGEKGELEVAGIDAGEPRQLLVERSMMDSASSRVNGATTFFCVRGLAIALTGFRSISPIMPGRLHHAGHLVAGIAPDSGLGPGRFRAPRRMSAPPISSIRVVAKWGIQYRFRVPL